MDADRKTELLKSGTYRTYTMKRRQAFMLGDDELFRAEPLRLDDRTGEVLETKQENFFGMNQNDLNDCERIRKAVKNQRERVEDHIEYLLQRKDLECFFLTFTFTDEALRLKKDTRKQAVRRILTDNTDDYILNIDFGKETDREHYHAFVSCPKDESRAYMKTCEDGKERLFLKGIDEYTLGFTYTERVNNDPNGKERLARYMSKLTLHSVKVNQQYISVKKGSDFQQFKKAKKRVTSQNRVNMKAYDGMENALHPAVHRFITKGKQIKADVVSLPIDPYLWGDSPTNSVGRPLASEG